MPRHRRTPQKIGVRLFRGGAYKRALPRIVFQGLGEDGLKILSKFVRPTASVSSPKRLT